MARKASKTKRLLKTLSKHVELKTPIATDMFLPNLSGDLSHGSFKDLPVKIKGSVGVEFGVFQDVWAFKYADGLGVNDTGLQAYPTGNAIRFMVLGNPAFTISTTTKEVTAYGNITLAGGSGKYYSSDGSAGATGSFTTTDGKTVTVKDGIITAIV